MTEVDQEGDRRIQLGHASAPGVLGAPAGPASEPMPQPPADVVVLVDRLGRLESVSRGSLHVLGDEAESAQGSRFVDLIHPDGRAQIEALLAGPGPDLPKPVTVRLAQPGGGSWRWIDVWQRGRDEQSTVLFLADATARCRAEQLLAAHTQVLELVAAGAPLTVTLHRVAYLIEALMEGAISSIMLADRRGARLSLGAAPSMPAPAVEVLQAGITMTEGCGACGTSTSRRELVVVTDTGTDPLFEEWRNLTLDSGLGACWSTPIISASTNRVLGAFATYYRTPRGPSAWELTTLKAFSALAGLAIERKETEDLLAQRALHDPVTGIANRSLLLDRLAQAIGRLSRSKHLVGVLFCDLDSFKLVNDSLGHEAGDTLLAAVGGRLQGALRACDTAARFGGDEFVLLCDEVDDERQLVVIAERMLEVLRAPFEVAGHQIFLTCSVGVAATRQATMDPPTLLRNADTAMYRAKATGRSGIAVFDERTREESLKRLEAETALHRALERGEISVVYQPQVALDGGAVLGAEALARWRHPRRGELLPAEFVPLAEDTGLIAELDRIVLQQACRQAAVWGARWPERAPQVWVNMSGRALAREQAAATVRQVLDATGVDPRLVGIEITESVLMEDVTAASQSLLELRALGVGIGIDDFGTGYSSLAYLKQLPVNMLKIDRSFVAGLAVDDQDRAVVGAVIAMAEALGLAVVAEGIESVEVLDALVRLGCRLGQGYLLGRPGPLEAIDVRLAATSD